MQELFYNGERFAREITLSIVDEVSDNAMMQIVLDEDSINTVNIFVDLYEPLPRIEISVKDSNADVVALYKPDGCSMVNFYIEYSDSSGEKYSIAHNFIINDVKVQNDEVHSITYLITGTSQYTPFYLGPVWHSSNKECTKIIEEILQTNLMPYKRNANLVHTNSSRFFISSSNMPMRDAIEYLLNCSCTSEQGIYELQYSLVENCFKLCSLSQLFKNTTPIYYNACKIATQYGFSDTAVIAIRPESGNFLGGTRMIEFAKEMNFHNFDYVNRKWSVIKQDHQKLVAYFPKAKVEEVQLDMFFKKPNTYFTQKNPMEMHVSSKCIPSHGKRMRDMFRLMNVLQVDVIGHILRDVGQLYKVVVDNVGQPLFAKHHGQYVITRLVHKWTKGQYLQEISLARGDHPDMNEKQLDSEILQSRMNESIINKNAGVNSFVEVG